MTDIWETSRNSWINERLWRGQIQARAESEKFLFVIILWTWFLFQSLCQVRRMSTDHRKGRNRDSRSPSDTSPPRACSIVLKSQNLWHCLGSVKQGSFQTGQRGTSPVVQWLRVCLPVQGTRSWSLVQESLCATTTESACRSYWSLCTYSLCSTTREATTMRTLCTEVKSSPRLPQLDKTHTQQWRPSTTENK